MHHKPLVWRSASPKRHIFAGKDEFLGSEQSPNVDRDGIHASNCGRTTASIEKIRESRIEKCDPRRRDFRPSRGFVDYPG